MVPEKGFALMVFVHFDSLNVNFMLQMCDI